MATETFKIGMNVDWLKNRLKEKPEYKKQWWVIWYEKESRHSAGMRGFKTKKEAVEWDEKNPPRAIPDGDFDTSEVFKS